MHESMIFLFEILKKERCPECKKKFHEAYKTNKKRIAYCKRCDVSWSVNPMFLNEKRITKIQDGRV